MITRLFLLVISLIGFLLPVGTVLGDGTVLRRGNNPADILQPTQKVYIHCDGDQERLVIQTKYEGPAEEMVWLIPVPARPTVERGDPNLFIELSKETQGLDISLTDFVALRYSTAGGGRRSNPVEWHDRIGDYDVALLSPAGAENVIAWLNANDFAVPDEAVPILADYIAKRWWMVAARIHPDALTEITQEALAKGALHPLDMRFETSQCVYPLRLTSLAGGPVEELIYIEGPNHYQPATLAAGDWDITVFGGPIRILTDEYQYSAVDQALEILAGRVTTDAERHLTKLRRVFPPEEMTDDLFFEAMDYTTLLASDDPNQIAQGATQLGRHRDPAGASDLMASLSPTALEQVRVTPEQYEWWLGPSAQILSVEGLLDHRDICWHLRSCIWALGEIALECELAPEFEATLLRCARHDSQFIRMEAYTALTKLQAPSLGEVLTERFREIQDSLPVPMIYTNWWQGGNLTMEMDMVADWIERFGTAQEQETFVTILLDMVSRLPAELQGPTILGLETYPDGWPGWVLWRAAWTQDARFLTPLQEFRARLAPEAVEEIFEFLLTAEAACGSAEAITLVARYMVDEQRALKIHADGYAYVPSLTRRNEEVGLRQWMLWQAKSIPPYYQCDMPPDICDTIARAALRADGLSDWWVLYLLGHVRGPQAEDRDRLMEVWNRNTGPIRVVAVDLLYVWREVEALLGLRDQAQSPEVQAEIAWALGELGVGEAPEGAEP